MNMVNTTNLTLGARIDTEYTAKESTVIKVYRKDHNGSRYINPETISLDQWDTLFILNILDNKISFTMNGKVQEKHYMDQDSMNTLLLTGKLELSQESVSNIWNHFNSRLSQVV